MARDRARAAEGLIWRTNSPTNPASVDILPIFGLVARPGKIDRVEVDRMFSNGLRTVATAARSRAGASLALLGSRERAATIVGKSAAALAQ